MRSLKHHFKSGICAASQYQASSSSMFGPWYNAQHLLRYGKDCSRGCLVDQQDWIWLVSTQLFMRDIIHRYVVHEMSSATSLSFGANQLVLRDMTLYSTWRRPTCYQVRPDTSHQFTNFCNIYVKHISQSVRLRLMASVVGFSSLQVCMIEEIHWLEYRRPAILSRNSVLPPQNPIFSVGRAGRTTKRIQRVDAPT